jgi:hypothetical protein
MAVWFDLPFVVILQYGSSWSRLRTIFVSNSNIYIYTYIYIYVIIMHIYILTSVISCCQNPRRILVAKKMQQHWCI